MAFQVQTYDNRIHSFIYIYGIYYGRYLIGLAAAGESYFQGLVNKDIKIYLLIKFVSSVRLICDKGVVPHHTDYILIISTCMFDLYN